MNKFKYKCTYILTSYNTNEIVIKQCTLHLLLNDFQPKSKSKNNNIVKQPNGKDALMCTHSNEYRNTIVH